MAIIRNIIRNYLPIFSLFALSMCVANAQISIEQCMELARNNYPQIKQLNLIEEAAKYDIASISKSWLPHLNISGKATYQSDVVEMPFDIPGFSFNLPHDQYSLVGDITQSIWDGGTSKAQKNVLTTSSEMQKNRWKFLCIP